MLSLRYRDHDAICGTRSCGPTIALLDCATAPAPTKCLLQKRYFFRGCPSLSLLLLHTSLLDIGPPGSALLIALTSLILAPNHGKRTQYSIRQTIASHTVQCTPITRGPPSAGLARTDARCWQAAIGRFTAQTAHLFNRSSNPDHQSASLGSVKQPEQSES